MSRRSATYLGRVSVGTRYDVECYGKAGNLKWTEGFNNLVTTAGLNKLLDATLKTGLASPAWYVGLKGVGPPAGSDTMDSHAGWEELVICTDSTRPVFTPGTISGGSVDNIASKADFEINVAAAVVYGVFLVDDNTVGGTTGTLYGVGDFAAPREVESGDIMHVQITAAVIAS